MKDKITGQGSGEKKQQLGFFVDARRCLGCFSCAMACKNQYHQPETVIWRKIYDLKTDIFPFRGRAFYSLACNHCKNPECLIACPVKAYSKREEDGIVIHDQRLCIGCKNCIRSCPYGVPQYNPGLKKAEKCSLCWQRIDAGLNPACIDACPVSAIQLIDVMNFKEAGTLCFPPGFPRLDMLEPSVRFRWPAVPRVVKGEKK